MIDIQSDIHSVVGLCRLLYVTYRMSRTLCNISYVSYVQLYLDLSTKEYAKRYNLSFGNNLFIEVKCFIGCLLVEI